MIEEFFFFLFFIPKKIALTPEKAFRRLAIEEDMMAKFGVCNINF